MKINLGKYPDLGQKFDYATDGWLNQNHDLLQGMRLGKINFVKNPSAYVVDAISRSGLNQLILVGGQQQVFLYEIAR